MTDSTPGTVLIAGATGLVGGECVRRFAARMTRVVVLVRRPLPPMLALPNVEPHVVDFGRLDELPPPPVSHVLCALGTTIRRAGTRERFRLVDHDYAVAVARLGLRAGARHFLLVSAVGASAGSRVFYNRVKGETERDVGALGYRSLTIVRPSLLLGDRDEFRLGEAIAKRFAFVLRGRLKPVQAGDVAAALLSAALEDRPGVRVLESDRIPAMARSA